MTLLNQYKLTHSACPAILPVGLSAILSAAALAKVKASAKAEAPAPDVSYFTNPLRDQAIQRFLMFCRLTVKRTTQNAARTARSRGTDITFAP